MIPIWLRLTIVTLAALLFSSSTGMAQPLSESIDSPDTTAYRRIFVPADSPGTWPTGTERYLPLAADQFVKLLEQAQEQRDRAATSARLSSAAYRGELVGDALLVGTVAYAIESPDGEPRVVPLEPLNLAILSKNWLSTNWQSEVATKAKGGAKWGLWNPRGAQHVWGVLAPRSGRLQIDWQLRAQSAQGEPLEFVMRLPPAVPQTLELSLPVDYQAVLPSAVLIRTLEESDGKQLWQFQLASHGPHHLQLLRQAATTIPQTQLRVSQATEYRLQPDGLDMTSTFRVEPQETLTSELRCSLSGNVKIASVTIEGKPVDWQMGESSADGQLTIRFPSSQKPQELKLRALEPIQFDQPWQLPAIRPLGDGWTEGTSLVIVSPALELRSLTARSATIEHIVGLQAEAASLEAYRVQEWSDQASLEVVVARRTPQLEVIVGTAADLGASETTARISAKIFCRVQPTYQIAAEIAPGWSIESVKAEPASALREWHVEDKGDQAVLHLQLNRSVRPNAPLAIEFDARAQETGALLPTTAGQLKILRFVDAAKDRQLVLLRSRPQGRMELLHGLERARISPEQLSPRELALLPSPIVGELVDLTELAANQVVALRPSRARYEVRVAAELRVLPQSSVQRYLVVCQPLDGPISEIAIRFDEPLPDTAEWMLFGNQGDADSRRLVVPDQENAATDDDAVYLLKLPYAATDEVRLLISYSATTQELTQELTFNSISFPQALRWSGQVALLGSLDGLQVDDSGWTPVGWDSTASGNSASPLFLGCYRLKSNLAGRIRKISPLVIHRTAAAADTLFAWLAEYQSHQTADGAAIHSAVYYLENSGAAEIEIVLPEQIELQASWLEQQQLAPGNLLVADRTYRFRLTEGQRYPTLALQYSSRRPALGRATTIEPVLPTCSIPIHLSRWTLWTPEQFVPDDLVTGYSARRVPWRQRLFGPLARAVGQEAFHPLRARDWPQLWSAPVEGLRTRLLAELFAARLATRIISRSGQTWGQLLGELVTAMRVEDVVSLDLAALRTAGIEANSRPNEATLFKTNDVATVAGVGGQNKQLASYGLALVVSPSRIIVTTSDRVAHWREDLRPTATPRVYYINSEHLTLEFKANSEQARDEFVSVIQWTAAPAPTAPVWNNSFLNSMSDVGHRACTIEFVDKPPSVVVRRAYVQQAYWYVVWLATVVGGMWWSARRTDWLVLVLAVAAAACMVAPPHWLTVPQAVLVGLLSALVLRMVFTKVATAVHDQSTQAIIVRSTPLALLACAILLTGEAVGAPLPNEQPAVIHDSLPRVLVPVDDAGKLHGEDVYLSESFLAALEGVPNTVGHDGTLYVLLESTIRGSLQSTAQERSVLSDPWTISLRIECFEPRCELELPLREADGTWINQLCTLDGKLVSLNWRPDGLGCRIEVLGAGVHHLKLSLQPKLKELAQQSHLQLHVPRMPGARLALTVPPTVEDLHIAEAGKIQTGNDTGVWRTTLTPTGVLRLDWATAGRQQLPDFARDLEQFSWLHVEQSVARLKVQLFFRGTASPPRYLQLEVSEQLKLLPPDEISPVEQIESQWDKPGIVRLQLKSGLGPNTRVPLEFQLQRTASIGKYFFPSVRLKGITPSRSLFAASVGSGLSYQEESADAMRRISLSEFSMEWGDAGGSPLFAYSLDQDDPEWSLRVWPDPETLVAQQSMQLHCQTHGVRVEYTAAVNQIAGKRLIHRLQAPAGLEIEEITISEQPVGEPLPIRWSRPSPSQVTVLLGRPTGRPHVLNLQGRIRPEPDGTVAVPQIVLQGANRGEIRMDLYRDPLLLVSWVDPRAAPSEIRQQNASRSSSEILVGRYTWRANQPSSERRIQLQVNNRRFKADTVTTVGKNKQNRTASLLARISVLRGVVAKLQISVPANFREPYVLQPATIGVVDQTVDSTDGRQVTLLLNQPVAAGQSFELEFSGRVDSLSDGRLAMPNLEVNGAVGGQHYVMLPTRLDRRAMEWQTAGLKREPLPENLRHFVLAPANQLPYRVVSQRFFAREPMYRGPLRNAALRQVWVEGVLDARGSLTATAAFVVQPGRATHCSIRLPTGARLMQLITDDLPARREQLSNGAWRIPLGPPFLPRVIKVSYLVEAQDLDERMRLTPPEVLIGDAALPFPPIDWKIRPVGGLRIKPTTIGSESSRAAEAEARHRRMVEMLEDSAPLAIELPVAEVRPWFRVWRAHVQSAWKQASTWDASVDEKMPFEPEPLAGEKPTPWSELVKKIETLETTDAISTPSAYPPDLPQRPTSSLGTGAVYLTSDSSGLLEISCSQLVVANVWRWVAAMAILVPGLMLERDLRSRPEWILTLCQRPHTLAFGVGVIWWSLLTPSAVGLLMLVLTLFSLTIELWQKHHQPQADNVSTQLTARVN